MYCRTSRDSRNSGTRRGIGNIRGHWRFLGGVGDHFGVSGGVGVRGILGLAVIVGTQGPEGV